MIFCFSGTGNSLHVAQKIAGELDDKVISISESLNKGEHTFTLADDERVGFVLPVYFYGLPTIVLDFISRLELHNYKDNYTYGIGTCGGDSGNMYPMLKNKLSGHGIHLDAAFDIVMPDCYILIFNLLPAEGKIPRILDVAETRITEVIDNIHCRKRIPVKSSIGKWFKTALSYPVYKYGRSTRPFHSTTNCNGCGLCARRCPCLMIEMEDNTPEWKEGKCTQCLACLHRCPQRAIEYGRKTQKRGRYFNPDVKDS